MSLSALTYETDHLIVGGGLSGLALAYRFNEKKEKFLLLEKSSAVGGRLATRRDQQTKFDHGAQFLKSRNTEFDISKIWEKQNLLNPWFQRDGISYFYGNQGMNSLGKKIAEKFFDQILLNSRLKKIKVNTGQSYSYCSEVENGRQIKARNVYLTCPVPQSLQILDDSTIPYSVELHKIEYTKALVGLIVLRKEALNSEDLWKLKSFYFQDHVSKDIFSISNQASKGLSQDPAFTVVMSPHFSQENFESKDELLIAQITDLFLLSFNEITKTFIEKNQIDRSQIKKWRYSHPVGHQATLHHTVCPGLILLGDGFGGGSINGALRSAYSIQLD